MEFIFQSWTVNQQIPGIPVLDKPILKISTVIFFTPCPMTLPCPENIPKQGKNEKPFMIPDEANTNLLQKKSVVHKPELKKFETQ